MWFRTVLIKIRKSYETTGLKLALFALLSVLLFGAIGTICDWLLPFSGWSNVIRSLLLLPIAVGFFVLFYTGAIFFHNVQISRDSKWIPLRQRISPTWRRRLSGIAAAFIIVFIYAGGERIGYTVLSSFWVAVIISLFAFMRTTSEEARRERYDIPDPRDVRYETRRAEYEAKLKKNRSKETD